MFMPDIKLIASDLDGTLLLDGAQDLSEDTCGLIREVCAKRGIIFFAASGRQYYSLKRLFAPIRDEIGYICENGCVNYYHDVELFKQVFSRDLAQEAIAEVLNFRDVEVMVSGDEFVYLQPKNPKFLPYMRDFVKYNAKAVSRIADIQEDFMKVAIFEEGGISDETREYFHGKFDSRATVVTSGNEWLDIIPKNANKGVALEKVLDSLGISPDECLALGDSGNDLEMLSLVKYPGTVESASDDIKQQVRIITDTVENLLRKFIA